MTTSEKESHPRIKSYILRQGRATVGQQNAIDNVWDDYCLDPSKIYDYAQIFGRDAPLIMEIGFGNGSSLAEMARNNPDLNYLGIEVHRPGVARLLMLLEEQGIKNVRIYHHDAIQILETKFLDHFLAGVHLFFPDPWQKRRHHKRRIVRPSFVQILNKKLKKGGYFHAATDWEHYAKDMVSTLSSPNSNNGLVNT
ncbi:MAG: tRNA (guanosine(46)-N7)-methyltransferase TrmB, partial [Gammaproteobacteria bacterium]|nr:tRNA (guanosine(46)-N7)-methyltransferase TrmB [Gammaproteobacteria bacterium]